MAMVASVLVANTAQTDPSETTYRLNGVAYAVPHKYEFNRNFRLPGLQNIQGLDRESDEVIWLLLPADEVSASVSGYQRTFRGYSNNPKADVVVQVTGGQEAREFADDWTNGWRNVAKRERSGSRRRPDVDTGLDRIIILGGEKGTLGEGHASFYLIPKRKIPASPDVLPTTCLSSPDIDKHERYYCKFTIRRQGLVFGFTVRQENLGTADRIPDYVLSQLKAWRSD